MGLFGGSKSSSTNTNITTTQNAGFSEVTGPAASNQGDNTNNVTGANAIGQRGTGNTLNVLDQGAIKDAFNFAETSSANQVKGLQEAIGAVSEAAKSQSADTTSKLQAIALYALLAWAGVKIFSKVKG